MMALPNTAEALALSDVPVSLPSDIHLDHPKVTTGMALLALSHTAIEHRIYQAMHLETIVSRRNSGTFSVRKLSGLSGLRSYDSVKRGCAGLISKQSIETIGDVPSQHGSQYRVFTPEEIFVRRIKVGMLPYPKEIREYEGSHLFDQVIRHVVSRGDLTRREALVAVFCAQGLSNAQIGDRLGIGEQTVKSHLRQIFDKFGVRRRTELVSHLLTVRSTRSRKVIAGELATSVD
jgi:DNA-binding CsgD family transcriptional regulator